jgi:poly-beta-1,6-N-acetyl-D-glucosamine synthase
MMRESERLMFSKKEWLYVLITPARDEEAFLEKTIESIICQTVLPQKWVIVSDGSTDRTDEIASKYEAQYEFIHLVRTEGNTVRNFGAKARAFNVGLEQLQGVRYDFIGNLDADVALGPTYYETVLQKFQQNPKLGLAGGTLDDVFDGKPRKILGSTTSVRGAIQLFRRQCYEDIGGYVAARAGLDTIAEVMTRMHGWEVRTFFELTGLHLRPVGGTFARRVSISCIRRGELEYALGYHPLFEIVKCLRRLRARPFLVGSALQMCGYVRSGLRRDPRIVPHDFIAYLRQEQLKRLRKSLSFFRQFSLSRQHIQRESSL